MAMAAALKPGKIKLTKLAVKHMQNITGHIRAAVEKYHMISPGDRIAVGVSGGKDSMFLLEALSQLRTYLPGGFELGAITIDPCFNNIAGDYTLIEEFCRDRDIKYTVRRSNLYKIIFEEQQEKNPCSLCARMRRGMLHNMCLELGMNKIALGHHLDDAVQTVLMNLFYGGRLGCFSPVTWLSRKELTMIRPLIFLEEGDIRRFVVRNNIPVVKSLCPADGVTARKDTSLLIKQLEGDFPDLKAKVIGAIQRAGLDGWGLGTEDQGE